MKVPVSPPPISDLFERIAHKKGPEAIARLLIQGVGPAPAGKYRHWDILRHLEAPPELDHGEWWAAIKMARLQLYQNLPLRDEKDEPFKYVLHDAALRALHEIDRDASGHLRAAEQVTNPQTRDTYLVRSLIEEAITSSQLEGAVTTREVAKDMIQRGRKPRDRSERMVINTYEAMRFIREIREERLTPGIIFELQRIVTAGTLDDETAAGRLRRADEDICVLDEMGTVLHRPPPAGTLRSRLAALCDFANGDTDEERFLHPVMRAITIHFMLGYDHPFADGNGRTARALFYWSMAAQGYWLCEYLSISRILKRAPAKYGLSFLYTETDDNDLTYFAAYQLAVIRRAIAELHAYLARKSAEIRETVNLIRQSPFARAELNYRQLALLNHAIKHPGMLYSIESHRASHDVSYQTARTDLMDLEKAGLVEMLKIGRAFHYRSPDDLRARIERRSRRK
ncbi:MAG: Fic family protein [Gemmatimonadota bacterium]